jgi:hypothetical protein
MELLTLLERAKSSGLTVEARGDRLVVKGRKSAAAIAQELGRQKDAVLAMLSKEAHPAATEPTDGKPDTGAGTKPNLNSPAHSSTTVNDSTNQSGAPSKSMPAAITFDGKTYEVAIISGMWFFRHSLEAGWTACSGEFAALIEERLQQGATNGNGN